MTSKFVGYQCSVCWSEYLPGEITYTCPKDGGNLDVILDFDAIRKKKIDELILDGELSLWRYQSLLPIANPFEDLKVMALDVGTPLRAVGWTPIYSPVSLAKKLGLKSLWIKDESRNPTASFKDRASAILVARAREIGAEVVVTASTGNAGAALAGMAAAVGHKAVIFAPKTAPPAKIAQLLIYGAQVLLVDGNYDEAFDLSIAAADEFGWYCRNTGYNPFTAEGKKTAAFEIFEQLIYKRRQSNDTSNLHRLCVFVSVGDGNIISGIHKGFKDLYKLGIMDWMPRIFGVQSERSAAIANAYNSDTEAIMAVAATTLADSISVDFPRDGLRALRAATQTDGGYITVSDEEIIQSIAELGSIGIFGEPAGATSYAGLVKGVQEGLIEPNDPVVVINTGSGLKDVRSAMEAAGEAPIIEPNLKALKKVI